ncbi:MAG: OmpA family protein [Firmicutes bacterium]|nr:OmpA family protein [Bacillota bacterium]
MSKFKRECRMGSDSSQGSPAWMTTYSDMVTLLLAFFIFLYSFSSVDLQRFQEVMSAIQHSFLGRTGILMGSTEAGNETGERLDISDYASRDFNLNLSEQDLALLEMMERLEKTYEKVRVFLQNAGLDEEIMLHLEERGIVMELPEKILFDTGRAELKEEVLDTLDLLAELISGLNNQVIVEGHTDNVPIRTFLYPSNWELSVARSVSVARYFVEVHHLSPKRFIATGYGEYHPLDTNDTPEGRARNRRVTIVLSIIEMEKSEVGVFDGE